MKRLVALMMCAVSLGAAAQSTITYPYNPDGNADAIIGVTDLQDMRFPPYRWLPPLFSK